jgi:L-seryl-tRNA(Ser) seleniumtransferase
MTQHPRAIVVDAVRAVIDSRREKILSMDKTDETGMQTQAGESVSLSRESLSGDIDAWVEEQLKPSMRKLVNATGVVIHTNLGRSILSESAVKAVARAASNYSNLEFDLEKGERGSRHSHIERILTKITGAEAAMVVNNNASAVLIALNALAHGKEAIVSRGQLVEIGGSFRIPDVMKQSGARLVEVGTTNKTYVSDYRSAIGEDTGLLMKVHPSNFRILGFTHEAALDEIVVLGDEAGLPVLEDLGSGVLIDLSKYGIEHEPTVQESIRAGVDVVTFSGDKLLGGPQAGLIVGKAEYITMMKKHPLARALRIDKMTLAALEATLIEYLDTDTVCEKNPTLRMITMTQEVLQDRAEKLAKMLSAGLDGVFDVTTEEDVSRVGGGSLPLAELPTTVVSVRLSSNGEDGSLVGVNHANMNQTGAATRSCQTINDIETALRKSDPPVIARIKGDSLLLDPRTIQTGEEETILAAFEKIMHKLTN